MLVSLGNSGSSAIDILTEEQDVYGIYPPNL
jgi:hypothetical protein